MAYEMVLETLNAPCFSYTLFWFLYCSNTEAVINQFNFWEDGHTYSPTFVIQQPKSFNILLVLQIDTNEVVEKTFDFLLYFRDNNDNKWELENYIRSHTLRFSPVTGSTLSSRDVFSDEEFIFNLPFVDNCEDVQFSFCVEVSGEITERCLNQTSFTVVCEKPQIG